VHRWYLSERAGHEVDIFETARDYIDTVLTAKPVEIIAADAETSPTLMDIFSGAIDDE
jgi:hypothetical protein